VHHVRVRNVLTLAPLAEGAGQQIINVPDFRVAIQCLLQAFQAATLDAHLLSVGQWGVDAQNAQGKSEAAPQVAVKRHASRMAALGLAPHRFPLGNLQPFGSRTSCATTEDSPLEGTWPDNRPRKNFPEGKLIHSALVPYGTL
jgi:hypothetical protein